MDHWRVRWYAIAASRSFWNTVRSSWAASAFFTNCCVIVGAALHHPLLHDVLVERAADAAQVDAVVGVEAPVLDGDDRVLHHRRDLVLAQEEALLVARSTPIRSPLRS